MNKQEIITKISEDIFPNGPNVEKTVLAVKDNNVILFDGVDNTVEVVYEFSQTNGFVTLIEKTKLTAEQWLTSQGYSPTGLITLFDLETRLASVQKTSPKLSAVRMWTNNILASYANDSSPRYAWTVAPHTFSDTTIEALMLLQSP